VAFGGLATMSDSRYVLYDRGTVMSELETSMPSRAHLMSIIGSLEGSGPTPPAPPLAQSAGLGAPAQLDASRAVQAAQAAQARHDQDAAALRDMTADRDSWRTAAQTIQAALSQQLDALRLELGQQRAQIETLRVEAHARDGQIAHLGAAMTALVELAQTRPPVASPVSASPVAPVAATPAAPAAPATTVGYAMPSGMEGRPATQPPPPPVDPTAPPMVIPSVAPDPHPPARPKARRVLAPVAPVAQAAAPEPEVDDTPPPEAVEFSAPEPAGGGGVILPAGGPEKRRRLHLGLTGS
jgi:hypothetical protein